MRKILIVEDEDILRESYEFILSTEAYDIYTATNGQSALEQCAHTSFDLILLDLMMPILNGVEFLKAFNSGGYPPVKIIIMSNLSAGDMLGEASKLGVHKNVVKADLTPRQLLSTVRYELEAN